MNTNLISVKVTAEEYKHFNVQPEIYRYILQLEKYIKNPSKSRLKDLYLDRFNTQNLKEIK